MNLMLWVVQVLLAVAFFAHGWLFLSPPPEIAEQMNASLPRWFQLFLGVAEVMVLLLAMATFVAYMRHRVPPIAGRRPKAITWAS